MVEKIPKVKESGKCRENSEEGGFGKKNTKIRLSLLLSRTYSGTNVFCYNFSRSI